jgi:hypothetical protein
MKAGSELLGGAANAASAYYRLNPPKRAG